VHLDALRGLAAFSVLLSHCVGMAASAPSAGASSYSFAVLLRNVLLLGHSWVIVFFVMSGYLVGGSVLRAFQSGRWCWRHYLLMRCTRLYAVLTPALLLGGLLDFAGMHLAGTSALYAGRSGIASLATNAYLSLRPRVFLENLLFLQNLHANNFGTNSVLWSLANEFWYYLAFPALLICCNRRWSWKQRGAYAVALLAWGSFAGLHVVLLMIPWLLGVVVAIVPPFPARPGKGYAQRALLAASLLLFALSMGLIGLLNGFPADQFPLLRGTIFRIPVADFPLSVVVALLIWAVLHGSVCSPSAAYGALARRAAHSSYTLYLFHLPMLIFLTALLQRRGISAQAAGMALRAAALLVIVAYTQLMYLLFENNTDKLRQWVRRRWMPQG
jgi:peptidoglycan/LPS O-acetylase OafA/YrhL